MFGLLARCAAAVQPLADTGCFLGGAERREMKPPEPATGQPLVAAMRAELADYDARKQVLRRRYLRP